jgi:hypothetical protein
LNFKRVYAESGLTLSKGFDYVYGLQHPIRSQVIDNPALREEDYTLESSNCKWKVYVFKTASKFMAKKCCTVENNQSLKYNLI